MTEISAFKFLECGATPSKVDLKIRKREAEVQNRKSFCLLRPVLSECESVALFSQSFHILLLLCLFGDC